MAFNCQLINMAETKVVPGTKLPHLKKKKVPKFLLYEARAITNMHRESSRYTLQFKLDKLLSVLLPRSDTEELFCFTLAYLMLLSK